MCCLPLFHDKFISTFRINLVNERKDMSFPAVSKKKVQSCYNAMFGVV